MKDFKMGKMKSNGTENSYMGDDMNKDIPQHEVEGAAHDLIRAEKHKSNKRLMKKVKKHLAFQASAISSIQDIKDARNQLATETDPDPDKQSKAFDKKDGFEDDSD